MLVFIFFLSFQDCQQRHSKFSRDLDLPRLISWSSWPAWFELPMCWTSKFDQMDGFFSWKVPLKWMIWGYPYDFGNLQPIAMWKRFSTMGGMSKIIGWSRLAKVACWSSRFRQPSTAATYLAQCRENKLRECQRNGRQVPHLGCSWILESTVWFILI